MAICPFGISFADSSFRKHVAHCRFILLALFVQSVVLQDDQQCSLQCPIFRLLAGECTGQDFVLYCSVLFSVVQYCSVLFSIVQYCSVLQHNYAKMCPIFRLLAGECTGQADDS